MARFLPNQLEEGEITWYMELWDNGKRVTTRMPRGMKEGRIPDRNRQLMSTRTLPQDYPGIEPLLLELRSK
jgi:hypothetical protein